MGNCHFYANVCIFFLFIFLFLSFLRLDENCSYTLYHGITCKLLDFTAGVSLRNDPAEIVSNREYGNYVLFLYSYYTLCVSIQDGTK